MSYHQRKEKILSLLSQQGELSIQQVVEHMDVSAVTARRDLDKLDLEGMLTRTHGGAQAREERNYASFLEKSNRYHEQKAYIARLASRYIQDGDSIMVDCGSTVFHLVPYLREVNRLTVITNSVPVLLALMDSPVEVQVIGGMLDKKRQAVHGLLAEENISRFKADKAFLGADGVSLAQGISAQSEVERGNTLTMMKAARQNFFLLDSAKFEKDALLQITAWEKVNHLITDNKLSEETASLYLDNGIHLIR